MTGALEFDEIKEVLEIYPSDSKLNNLRWMEDLIRIRNIDAHHDDEYKPEVIHTSCLL